MFDRSLYDDIAPYDEAGCKEAIDRILTNPERVKSFVESFIPGEGEETEVKRKQFVDMAFASLKTVHNYDDFQTKVTSKLFLSSIIKNSVNVFTSSGAEKLSKTDSYLYISTHRDIVLDCALIDYALYLNDIQRCEMAIGDNLLKSPLITDLMKLNGAIVVKRSLPLREKYKESMRLSRYFVERLESGKSIWVAQKSGRSKDGIDATTPAIIKMLYLSKRDTGISFAELIRGCRIVPVAVSYEFNPNDINMGRESLSGEKEKKPLEDVISMTRGIRENKGNIDISFGTPLTDRDYNNADEVATEIDRQIHLNYKLWPTNYVAYNVMEKKNDFREEIGDFDKDSFLKKYDHLSADVRSYVLNSYANPVRMYLKEKGEV